jgi:hypothetical protein
LSAAAVDCVKAFGHVLYKKYEKNTNNKKNTKILERNTKKTMKAKEMIIKHEQISTEQKQAKNKRLMHF